MINLPVSVCYGIAAASVPAVATAAAVGQGARKRIWISLFTTVAVGIPSAMGLYLFAQPAANLIFRSLQQEELTVLVGLIKSLSVSALTLSCIQTLSACLTAQGKPQYAALSMLVGVGVKTALYCWWMQDAKISVFALAYATNICYLLVFFLDLLYNLAVSKKRRKE
jgi:O-antigen/teichoic acid export membrane protein